MNMIEDVRTFMEASGQLPCKVTPELLDLRARMLAEEAGELLIAWAKRDVVGVADGLVDIVYISLGTCLAVGAGEPWDNGVASTIPRLIEHISSTIPLYEYTVNFTPRRAAQNLGVACYCPVEIAEGLGLPFKELWSEVHHSNMAKWPFHRDAFGKIIKPPGWTPPDIAGVLLAHGVEL